MNKCAKFLTVGLMAVCLAFTGCEKAEVGAGCFVFRDCAGNDLQTSCGITQSEAEQFVSAHSSAACRMTFVKK